MKEYIVSEYGVTVNTSDFQTEKIQAVLDLCRNGGGKVIFPAGTYRLSSVQMWSDTTLYLCAGARLEGSEECDDYEVYDVPAGVELRTDMEMIVDYYDKKPWKEYRRAMISAYGQSNIAIIGESGAVIDGKDCYDPHGEEGFRGPHGIFLTNCQGVTLRGYTIQNCGNFMHQVDACTDVLVDHVTALAGHDGIHLHCCERVEIVDCVFHTGDDCIAGINMRHIHVTRCDLNTSCNLFRIGGTDILVEHCHMFGPGYYPHRMTVVRGKHDVLPREAGRHNLLNVVEYFSSQSYPSSVPAHDITFRDCEIENAEWVLHYDYGSHTLQTGTALTGLTFERVHFLGVGAPSYVHAKEDEPLRIVLRNVTYSFRDGREDALIVPTDTHTTVVTE